MELEFGGNRVFCFSRFGPVFGQSWGQERAQMPRLEKRYINQRTWDLDIIFKAPIGPCASAERRVELDFGGIYFMFSWFLAGFRPKLGPGTCPNVPA